METFLSHNVKTLDTNIPFALCLDRRHHTDIPLLYRAKPKTNRHSPHTTSRPKTQRYSCRTMSRPRHRDIPFPHYVLTLDTERLISHDVQAEDTEILLSHHVKTEDIIQTFLFCTAPDRRQRHIPLTPCPERRQTFLFCTTPRPETQTFPSHHVQTEDTERYSHSLPRPYRF